MRLRATTAGALALSAAGHLALFALRLPHIPPRAAAPERAAVRSAPPIEVELLPPVTKARESPAGAPAPRTAGAPSGGLERASAPRLEKERRQAGAPGASRAREGRPSGAMSLSMRPHAGAPSGADRPAPAAPGPSDVARLAEPDPGPPPAFRPFEAMPWRRPKPPRSELRPSGGGTRRAEDTVFTARVGRDGRVQIEDKANVQLESPLSGSFDLNDAVERLAGNDPYLARKLDFLDRTREERAGIALAHRSEDLRQAVVDLKERLAEVWAHRAWPPAKRRRILFLLWDECAERGPAQVVEAAEQARATIESFIRRELPAGGQDRYRAKELRRLNAERTSERRFAPYR